MNALNSGLPLLVEISDTQVQVNVIRPTNSASALPASFGMTFANNSNTSKAA